LAAKLTGDRAVAEKSKTQFSPHRTARIAGLFYFLLLPAGALATVARRGLIVKGNAVATGAAIAAHQTSFILSFVGEVFVVASYVVVIALFYRLFKPVNGNVSLTAAFIGLAACAIQAVACAFYIGPLIVLQRDVFNAFTIDQLHEIAYMFIRLYTQLYDVALVFFAFFGILTGYLIFKSNFLPRFIGVMMMFAGFIWLSFLSPPFGQAYLPYIMISSIGELVLTLWLLVKGVDQERWMECARSSA
jgi:hypothetical protein